MAICLICYNKPREEKEKFWLTRFNGSSVKSHFATHKSERGVSDKMIVSEHSFQAAEAMKEYRRIMARYTKLVFIMR